MWADAESYLLCVALGGSLEHPRSEVKGISEVQRRTGTRAYSHSEWWQSRAASQVQETVPDLCAHEWHRV